MRCCVHALLMCAFSLPILAGLRSRGRRGRQRRRQPSKGQGSGETATGIKRTRAASRHRARKAALQGRCRAPDGTGEGEATGKGSSFRRSVPPAAIRWQTLLENSYSRVDVGGLNADCTPLHAQPHGAAASMCCDAGCRARAAQTLAPTCAQCSSRLFHAAAVPPPCVIGARLRAAAPRRGAPAPSSGRLRLRRWRQGRRVAPAARQACHLARAGHAVEHEGRERRGELAQNLGRKAVHSHVSNADCK
jgi:hypothetical protein